MTDLCLCAGAPHAKGVDSDHLINMAEHQRACVHPGTPALMFALQSYLKIKETYVCPVHAAEWETVGITFSQAVLSYKHELEILPSALTVLTDEST